ncbi:CHAD domain-containing protein [Caballeronia sp. LZ001]|uniref:CHAD domain-containing protein n=1 Tax=Caballeronia sp. LZ001 TaxID=3038553 RepID=UPI002866FC55|nr:CHAD domain-containing protein [Caballeronia sp. LZ001]MDR5801350.1 CHAD domain-containing protein [Caballeronia sp. LZ001]
MKSGRSKDTLSGVTAESQFRTYASPLVEEALQHAHELEQSDDAETLHKLRIALRRLRSLFWAYRPILDDAFDDKQRALLRYLAQAAGSTRDWDILIELMSEHEDTDLAQALRGHRDAALRTSKETLNNADIKGVLREAVAEANRELNTAKKRVAIEQFASDRVRNARRQLKKRIKRARQVKRPEYAALHEVRKAGKKVRYLIEFFMPLLAEKERGGLKQLKRLQKHLGALNDVVASRDLLDKSDALPNAAAAKPALRTLKKQQKRRMKQALKSLR